MKQHTKQPVTVLIVDDNEVSRTTLSRFVGFKLPEIRIHTAENCRTGIKLCKRHKIDMVITDIKSADLQCRAMVSTVRRINRDAEFILITSSSDPGNLNATSKALDVSLVQMPVDLFELLKVTKANIDKIASKHGRHAADTA